jgi:hypothetical protein
MPEVRNRHTSSHHSLRPACPRRAVVGHPIIGLQAPPPPLPRSGGGAPALGPSALVPRPSPCCPAGLGLVRRFWPVPCAPPCSLVRRLKGREGPRGHSGPEPRAPGAGAGAERRQRRKKGTPAGGAHPNRETAGRGRGTWVVWWSVIGCPRQHDWDTPSPEAKNPRPEPGALAS